MQTKAEHSLFRIIGVTRLIAASILCGVYGTMRLRLAFYLLMVGQKASSQSGD